jgi:hypothetical protein
MQATNRRDTSRISNRGLLARRTALICSVTFLASLTLGVTNDVIDFSPKLYTALAIGLVAIVGGILTPLVFLSSPVSANEYRRILVRRRTRKSVDLTRLKFARPHIAYNSRGALYGGVVLAFAFLASAVISDITRQPSTSNQGPADTTTNFTEPVSPVSHQQYQVDLPPTTAVSSYVAPSTDATPTEPYDSESELPPVVCLISVEHEIWAKLGNETYILRKYLKPLRPNQPKPPKCHH